MPPWRAQVRQVGFWIIAAQAGDRARARHSGRGGDGPGRPEFVGGTAALAFLLAAEVVAATAVVTEAALVYVARHRNLLISLAMLALQAILSVALILAAKSMGLPPISYAAAAALALMIALGFASLVKAAARAHIGRAGEQPALGARLGDRRRGGARLGATQLPEWAELLLGMPVILGVYSWLIWTRGFGPEDRVLFAKQPETAPTAPAAPPA